MIVDLNNVIANMTGDQLQKFIDDRIEERIRSRMIGQNDILPQTIKERHIDWEEFGVTLNSSIIQKVSELVQITSTGSASASVVNGADESVTVTIADSGGSTTRVILAVIHISAYEGSVAAANHIPWGSGLAAGDYERSSFHDWGTNDNLKSTAIDYVRNTSGGDVTVLWRANARYIGQLGSAS